MRVITRSLIESIRMVSELKTREKSDIYKKNV